MATHSSTLAWKIPWTEEPGRLQSMGLPRVGHFILYLLTYLETWFYCGCVRVCLVVSDFLQLHGL